jgi:hypothetical protein
MKKIHVLILLLMSLITSRLILSLVEDSEGPNLLIVTVLAMLILAPLLIIYSRHMGKKYIDSRI